MFKKWISECIVLAISLSTQATLHGDEGLRSGTQIIQRIDDTYRKGEYDDFLSTMHSYYQKAGKAGALRGIFESTKNAMQKSQYDIFKDLKRKRHEVAKLSTERNQRLLQAISGNPDLDIVQKVDTVVFTGLTDEQEEILSELEALKLHVPETVKATLKNKISALETEYYIKTLLLDVGDHVTKDEVRDLEIKKTILQLAKLDKMLEVANEYGEIKWVEKLEKAKVAYRAKRTFSIDYDVLQSLGRGTLNPQNPVEEKVKEIMMEYLGKRELVLAEVAGK